MKGRKTSKPRSRRLDDVATTLAYFDQQQNGSTSTSVNQLSLLNNLLSNAGLMNSFAQFGTPVMYGPSGTIRTRVKLKLIKLEFNMRTVGSQSNTIASADLFNTMRYVVYITGETFQSTVQYALANVDSGLNTLDIERVLIDKVDCLPSQAFDTVSNYNVPDMKYKKYVIPLNFDLEVFSSTAPGTAGTWETRERDINLELVSDSSAAPNPQYFYNARIFFKVSRN